MLVKDLGSRPVPASIRGFFQRLERGHGPTTVVRRREVPYWQERGWKQDGNQYTGTYQTAHASFVGRIEQKRSGSIEFFLYGPSQQIKNHGHFVCFQHRGNNWFFVHMGKRPKDVSSGILTIERLIAEAYGS